MPNHKSCTITLFTHQERGVHSPLQGQGHPEAAGGAVQRAEGWVAVAHFLNPNSNTFLYFTRSGACQSYNELGGAWWGAGSTIVHAFEPFTFQQPLPRTTDMFSPGPSVVTDHVVVAEHPTYALAGHPPSTQTSPQRAQTRFRAYVQRAQPTSPAPRAQRCHI